MSSIFDRPRQDSAAPFTFGPIFKPPSIDAPIAFNPQPQPPPFHPNFCRTAESDVILSSHGGTLFATRQVFLEASSSVFRDKILPELKTDPESAKLEGLPVIKLAEDKDTIQRFLALSQTSPLIQPRRVELLSSLDELYTMCTKYDAPHVGLSTSLRCFQTVPIHNPMDTLAVALIHWRYCSRPTVEQIFVRLGSFTQPSHGVDVPGPMYQLDGGLQTATAERTLGRRAVDVADIAPIYLRRMAIEDVVEIARLQMKISQESRYDYKQAARDFKMHGQRVVI